MVGESPWDHDVDRAGTAPSPAFLLSLQSCLAHHLPTSFPHSSHNRVKTFETGFLRDGAALGGGKGRRSALTVLTGMSSS